MKVKDLIKFLERQNQEMLVAYEIYSEQCLLKEDNMNVKTLCEPRPDGWVANKRGDKPSVEYLVFDGN